MRDKVWVWKCKPLCSQIQKKKKASSWFLVPYKLSYYPAPKKSKNKTAYLKGALCLVFIVNLFYLLCFSI